MKLSMVVTTCALALGIIATPLLVSGVVEAQDCANPQACVTEGFNKAGGDTATNKDLGAVFKIIANALLFLVGAIAVVMLIIGGMRYVTSQGDSSHVKAAKDTILYSVIGIIVAILGYAIVNFVITAFTTK